MVVYSNNLEESVMQNYWELIQFDDTRIEIPPSGVDAVKRAMTNNQPIHTAHSGSIPANQIKAFRPTDKPFISQPLLEDVARAFNEPIYNDKGEIKVRLVKRSVTKRSWEKHYINIPSYKRLNEEYGNVWIAFWLPVHQINIANTPYCTEEEISSLNRG